MDLLLNDNNNNALANNNTKLLRWPIFLYVHFTRWPAFVWWYQI